ncbi:hypothetical protein HK103_002958 [Boothiomyces macroporosus]|uniref:Uncharacterized protein n=1 Tax=Boothiomyces macroporosus TaxID=261099 RepID=A0AAD5UIH3_9FUNG|nr:hypothetical protein HK103_002958 [Boothiomyces macroporosus]
MSNGKENEDRIAFLKEQLASQKRINSQIEEINYWKDRLDQQTEISSKLSHQLDILQKENYSLKRELLYYKNSGKDVGPPPSTPALHPNLKRKNSIPYYDNRMMDRVPPYKEKVVNQENVLPPIYNKSDESKRLSFPRDLLQDSSQEAKMLLMLQKPRTSISQNKPLMDPKDAQPLPKHQPHADMPYRSSNYPPNYQMQRPPQPRPPLDRPLDRPNANMPDRPPMDFKPFQFNDKAQRQGAEEENSNSENDDKSRQFVIYNAAQQPKKKIKLADDRILPERKCDDCQSSNAFGFWVKDHNTPNGVICQKCYYKRINKPIDFLIGNIQQKLCPDCLSLKDNGIRAPDNCPKCAKENENKSNLCNACKSISKNGIWYRDTHVPGEFVCHTCHHERHKIKIDTLPDGNLIHRTCAACAAPKSSSWYRDSNISGAYICKQCYNQRYQARTDNNDGKGKTCKNSSNYRWHMPCNPIFNMDQRPCASRLTSLQEMLQSNGSKTPCEGAD